MTPAFSPTGASTSLAEMTYTMLLESPQAVLFLCSPLRDGATVHWQLLHEDALLVLVVTPRAGAGV